MSAAADVPDLGGEDDVRQRSPEGDGRADCDGDGEAVGPGLRVVWAEGDDVVDGSRAGEDWVAGGLVAGEGDGEGVEVLEAGRTWHTVSVFAVVAIGAACASASRPRVRKLPLSKVTAATLTCAKRIRIACLRCSSGLPCALRDSEATKGRMGMCTHIRKPATYASPVLRITVRVLAPRYPGLCLPVSCESDGPRAGSVP